MEKLRQEGELRDVVGTALLLVLLAFLLPVICFGGSGGETRPETETADPEGTESPAVLLPLSAVEEGEWTALTEVSPGELDTARTVRVLGADGAVQEMSMSEYLWGVVAAEMPASFELEALKAQSVAGRTYTLWKTEHNSAHPQADICTDHTCCQAWIGKEQAAENWGEHAEQFERKIASAVARTDGMVICWEGMPIQAVYHSSSDGSTEDAVAVWGSTVPYLLGVDTPEGEEVPNYRTTIALTKEEVAAALEGFGCDLSGDPSTWFQAFLYTQRGAVSSAQVGGVMIGGGALRSALGLRSASFEVSYAEELFTFRVTGYGHGVGMSQYGANALAKEGKSWEEIVGWYYTGVTLETYGI